MRFDNERRHGRHDHRDGEARMGRHGKLFDKGFLRARGPGGFGPFGRHGGRGRDFDGDDFGGGFEGRRGHGGEHRGRRLFAQGELRLLLLDLLTGDSRHGYDLIKAIEELTGGTYAPSPGVVYPTLALMADEGLIAETAGEGARRAFVATEAGKAEAEAQAEAIAAITARLKALAEASTREASPPVMRAMANLRLALKTRVFAKGFDEQTAFRIADILDEAARQIERL